MTNDQFSTLLEYLDKLGAKLGVGVNEVWPWFVKQQYIEPCHSFILFAATLLVFYFGARFAKSHWNTNGSGNYSISMENHELPCVILFVVVGLFAAFFLATFIGEFMDIFNPEYAAFKDLTTQILQAKPE
jgi:hypothetical protein